MGKPRAEAEDGEDIPVVDDLDGLPDADGFLFGFPARFGSMVAQLNGDPAAGAPRHDVRAHRIHFRGGDVREREEHRVFSGDRCRMPSELEHYIK
ncbi:hypothetical protein GUJ93_ZPchr0003g16981 [Zizania palustris]|uniref:Uncharacterized protein n=1 Tax=Zizania palustris TaxID=103762 RepID=A0A8J5S8D3_ZIZPA|nr:hypothetical protein GUJ93_ZPchr0003g16981 [Zizania palustris]